MAVFQFLTLSQTLGAFFSLRPLRAAAQNAASLSPSSSTPIWSYFIALLPAFIILLAWLYVLVAQKKQFTELLGRFEASYEGLRTSSEPRDLSAVPTVLEVLEQQAGEAYHLQFLELLEDSERLYLGRWLPELGHLRELDSVTRASERKFLSPEGALFPTIAGLVASVFTVLSLLFTPSLHHNLNSLLFLLFLL